MRFWVSGARIPPSCLPSRDVYGQIVSAGLPWRREVGFSQLFLDQCKFYPGEMILPCPTPGIQAFRVTEGLFRSRMIFLKFHCFSVNQLPSQAMHCCTSLANAVFR